MSKQSDRDQTVERLDWTKPGPGTWTLDASHYPPDCATLAKRAIEIGATDGVKQGFDLIGAPLRRLAPAFVNGNLYFRMEPLIAGDRDLPPPPAPVIWLMTRLNRTFRKREKIARQALDDRIWNQELERWENEHRPFLIGESSRLTAAEPAAMTNEELVAHLNEVIDLVNTETTLHFRLHISDLGPIGLLLVKAKKWGLDQHEIMATMAGASPATSAPMVALYRIGEVAKAAVGPADGSGSGSAPSQPFGSLDEVRRSSSEAAKLLDSYQATYGHRLTTGYDLQDRTLIELPELLLSAINSTPQRTATEADTAAAESGERAMAAILPKVPQADQDEFKRLVADARALYGLRDENGPLTYQWPAGLLRRALLVAAKRLLETGRITALRQVFDLEADELEALLLGGDQPTAGELADRLAERTEWVNHQAPAVLGLVAEDPPMWTLPGALAELMEVIITVMDLIETSDKTPTLDGIGVGDRSVVGTARVVTDEIDALTRMEPGDVLIAPFTVPTYNAVLATAGAVVVENGGLLCHAAVIAREFDIPGLVGVSGVTGQITDGSLVTVDPVAGTIRELNP